MIQSRVFVWLAITLFVLVCLCAEAADSDAYENNAKEVVTALQELTATVLDTAETKFSDAESAKSSAEDLKNNTFRAESVAKRAAAEIKAKERKAEAEAVAKEAEKELEICDTLYKEAKEKAGKASESFKGLVLKAKTLVQSAKIRIPDRSNNLDDYKKIIQSAANITSDAERLSEQVNGSTIWADADAALLKLKDSAKKVQVFKYQVESLAIVSEIESVLKTAETDIQSIQQTKDKINAIIQEMKKTFESAPNSLKGFFSSLCNNAEGFLRIATKRVTEAHKCNKTMLDLKTQVDETLKTLNDTDEESDAKTQFVTVKWRETSFALELQKIKRALQAAEIAFKNAQSVQQQMLDTIEKTPREPIEANLENTKQNKSTQLTHKQKQSPKDDNSKVLNNEKVRKITKNMTNNPLIGGEVPTRSAANDSAVTVFITLLVILVITAVLH